jgi:leucyl-tRNA synthetase
MHNFKEIETKWQSFWTETGLYKTPSSVDKDKKYYLLEMFAYPSGDLHIGHFRNYSIGDAVWRKLKMEGKHLLHPFGWDAFGMPAEQAAIKNKKTPGKWTEGNIKTSKETLNKLSISYDWEREIATCLPDYYRWTQWMFLALFKQGLVYQDEAVVNWCPDCKTVLANEQVEQGGCWRCHNPIQKKKLKQWFIRITDYARDSLTILLVLRALGLQTSLPCREIGSEEAQGQGLSLP